MRLTQLLIWSLVIVLVVPMVGQAQLSSLSVQQKIEVLNRQFEKDSTNIDLLEELVEQYNLNSKYSKAEKTIRGFLTYRLKKETKRKGEVYLLYAVTLKYQSDYSKALYFFLKAKDEFQSKHQYIEMVKLGAELTEFYRRQAKHEEARKTFYNYSFYMKVHHVQDPVAKNKLYNRFAAVLNEHGDATNSIVYSKKAIIEALKLNDLNAQAISFNEMGFSYKNLRRIEESKENYRKAEELWMSAGCYRDGIQAKMNGLTLIAHNKMIPEKEQIKQAKEILKLIDAYQVDYPKIPAYEIIRTSYVILKDFERALEYEQLLTGEHLKSAEDRLQSEVADIQEKYDNEKLRLNNGLIQNDVKLKKTELKALNHRLVLFLTLLLVVILALVFILVLWIRLKRTNAKLRLRNEQKTMLVQEIHHRVKNNLQFVRSMLDMQMSADETNHEQTASLMNVSRRIDAMSLVHEMLFLEEDNMHISVQEYLNRLLTFSNEAFLSHNKVKFDVQVENLDLSVEKVVSIGIICSELVTNSMKHAFENVAKPEIQIRFFKKDFYYHLEIADNGKSIQAQSSVLTANLGMRLVDIFSRQLNGSYSINRKDGYCFKLQFK